MTRLQELCLDKGDGGRFKKLPECIMSLLVLSGLTCLTVISSEAGNEQLVMRLAAQPLPVLQALTLAMYDPFSGDSDLARYAGSLPALRRLTVHLRHSRHGDYSDARGDLDSAEHPENVARRRLIDAENCL